MKSTLVNMTAVLFGITLVASAGVGAVNMITAEPIAQAEQAAKVEALKVVLRPFDQTADDRRYADHGLHRNQGRTGRGLRRGVDDQERFRRRDQHDGGLHARR